jgi:putative hydrolase of the HAD superfamily
MNIKNIIFDLGGVLYDIDYRIMENAFKKLVFSSGNNELIYSRTMQDELFDAFETGKIEKRDFKNALCQKYSFECTQVEFESAWNAMLLGLFPFSTEITRNLSEKVHLTLLSNTNELHYEFISPECKPLFDSFSVCYFSHKIGMRKPQAEIFQKVLSEQKYKPEETLYFEDSPQHIEMAALLGIHTVFVTPETKIKHELQRFGL